MFTFYSSETQLMCFTLWKVKGLVLTFQLIWNPYFLTLSVFTTYEYVLRMNTSEIYLYIWPSKVSKVRSMESNMWANSCILISKYCSWKNPGTLKERQIFKLVKRNNKVNLEHLIISENRQLSSESGSHAYTQGPQLRGTGATSQIWNDWIMVVTNTGRRC